MPGLSPMWARLRRLQGTAGTLQASPTLVWLLLAGGIVLRLRQYLANPSLWLDEALLAPNILNRSFAGLFFPLDEDQGAPPGFLVLAKLSVLALGPSEYALRLPALIAGIASLPLFILVARRFLSPRAVPIALALFALLDPLIFYASEAKQYMGDVAVTLLLLAVAWPHERAHWTLLRGIAVALTGAAGVWLSHPAPFVLAAIGLVLLARALSGRRWGEAAGLSAVVAVWVSSFAALYVVSLRGLESNATLREVLANEFLPLGPSLAARWLLVKAFEVLEAPGLRLPGLAALVLLAGGLSLVQRGRSVSLVILLSPLLVALAASVSQRYPFTGRFLLFAAPLILLAVAEGAAFILEATRPTAPAVGALAVGLLLLHPVLSGASNFVQPRLREEVRPVLAYLKQQYRPGDMLYVYYGSAPAYSYYAMRSGLRPQAIIGVSSREDWRGYAVDLDRLRGHPRVWVLFSHSYDAEEAFFLFYLDRQGGRLDAFRARGASIYLYDLSKAGKGRG